MKSAAATVPAYLKELPEDRRKALGKLRALIRRAVPDAKECMQSGLACYVLGELIVALGSQKNHMAFYCCDTEVVDQFRSRLGKLNCGKGCIRFKKLEDVPLDVISEILAQAAERRRAGQAQR